MPHMRPGHTVNGEKTAGTGRMRFSGRGNFVNEVFEVGIARQFNKYYRHGSGRDQYLKEIWGKETEIINSEKKQSIQSLRKRYSKNS